MITRSLAQGRRHQQRGAALLVFMLILILGSGYLLLNKLNGHYSPWSRTPDTYAALKQAKAALIGYAVSYPDRIDPDSGPGYLPCPDINNDGSPLGNCSDGPPMTTVGRLPWRYLGIGDLRDASGERLWYALSQNYRYGPSKTIPLNSETPGQLTVDGIPNSDVVAVLIAPGEALSGQDRDLNANAVGNYLEGDNKNANTNFIHCASNVTNCNDRIITITRQELMRAVERRVLAEAGNAFENYRTVGSSYPWLSTYVNPRASVTTLTGNVATGSNSTTLIDSGADFVTAGVQAGDLVENTTNGTRARVQSITINTLGLDVLSWGGTSSFNPGDTYRIKGSHFNGVEGVREGHIPYHEADEAYATAFSVSWNLPLANGFNTTATSSLTDVIPAYLGKLQEFLQSNQPAASDPLIVVANDGNCIWANEAGLAHPPDAIDVVDCGGSVNVSFYSGVVLQNSSDELKDQDSTVNFINLGISRGDLIQDITDGFKGVIEEVQADKLKVTDLHDGANNSLTGNDNYRVRVASRALTGTIDNFLFGTQYVYSGTDLQAGGVVPGDYIVNLSQGEVGKIQSVGSFVLFGIINNYFTVASSPDGNFSIGDTFEVRQSFVDRRNYSFRLDYVGNGVASFDLSGSARGRDVILNNAAVGLNTTIKITDFDTSNNILATALLTVPGTGNNGDISTRSIQYDFNPWRNACTTCSSKAQWNTDHEPLSSTPPNPWGGVDEELPDWFFTNDWHHLIYAAEANAPGGSGSCTPGTDCLTVNNSPVPVNDKRLVLTSSGSQLAGQDRNTGVQADYFENENADGGPVFDSNQAGAGFNDQLRYYGP